MNTTKKTGLFIGTGVSAFLIAVLLFLPVIPITYAGSAQALPCGNNQWTPFSFQNEPPFSRIKLNNLSLGLSFAYQVLSLDSHSRIRSNGNVQYYTTHTNKTLTLDLNGFAVAHNNGTIAKFAASAIINGSTDSYLRFYGLSIITKNFNATTFKIFLAISHVEILVGPYLNQYSYITEFPVGIPISFNNFKMNWLYNCATGKTSYAFAGMTNGINAIGIASDFIGHHLTGAMAFPTFSGAST